MQVQKALAESAEIIERNSQGRNSQGSSSGAAQQSNTDVLKLVEDYSRQNELKTKELELITAKVADKKEKMTNLKRNNVDLQGKL